MARRDRSFDQWSQPAFPSRKTKDTQIARCQLCGRQVAKSMLTLHHLTPKARGGKSEDRTEMCRPCHKQVHAIFDNVELERGYGSIEQLRSAPQMQKFIRWIRRQDPHTSFRTFMSGEHPHRRRKR